MIEQLPRQRVLNFLDAFYGGDSAAALKCCDDDIESMVYLPVELFPHLGPRRGTAPAATGGVWRCAKLKASVTALCTGAPARYPDSREPF